MRKFLNRVIICTTTILLLFLACVNAQASQYRNPLVEPYEITEYVELSDHFVNILLLGIDFGSSEYLWGSGNKRTIENCHTDAVMIVTINLDKKKIDLISLPRDTVTYIPGVKGIYKLNAAVNCAETLDEGLLRTKSAAEWLLGNIKIDHYFAVDMNAMIALGDAIGGVDFEMDMNYNGEGGRRYYKGMQHLDGTGIMDYLRARTNATVDYNDIGRTNRQREMILAIFEKLRSDEELLWNVFNTAIAMSDGFFTDITTAVVVQLAMMIPTILSVDAQDIGTHVFTGLYRTSNSWNFTFTDQDNRLSVINDVFGIVAEPIPYVSYQYTQWLDDMAGFSSVHFISVAQQLMDYVNAMDLKNLTSEQQEACKAFDQAYQEAVSAFEIAADSMSDDDSSVMYATRAAMRDAAEACAKALGYAGDLHWSHNRQYWYNDPFINEYQLNWK